MRVRLLPIILAITTIVGCAKRIAEFAPSKTVMRSYQLGVERSVAVGDPIVTVSNGYLIPSYAISYSSTLPHIGVGTSGIPVDKGTIFDVVGEVESGRRVIFNKSVNASNGIIIDPSGVVNGGWIMVTHDATRGIVPVQGDFSRDTLFTRLPDGTPMRGSFKAELIFTGITGGTMKVVYREYMDDYARPAFTTELQYNLDESKSLTYKSIKIEVLKATNQSLTYRVISDDNLPWVK